METWREENMVNALERCPGGEHEALSLVLANGGKNFLTPGPLNGQILLQLMTLGPLESHFDQRGPTAINRQ